MKWMGIVLVACTCFSLSGCKDKTPAPTATPDQRPVAERPEARAGDGAARAREPVPPVALAPSTDAGGGASVAPAVGTGEAIERIRALEAYRRLVAVVGEVDKLARAKAWDRAVGAMREVDNIGKRLKDDSHPIAVKAPPAVTDFVTRLASFVIDARTELSMIEVDQSAEQKEKSVRRFVELGKVAVK